jgi:hypothetical protein
MLRNRVEHDAGGVKTVVRGTAGTTVEITEKLAVVVSCPSESVSPRAPPGTGSSVRVIPDTVGTLRSIWE